METNDCKITRKLLKISVITASVLLGLIIIVLSVLSFVLTPDTLTKMVNKYSNEYLNATVTIDTVKMNLFSEFPYVGVELHNGEIISNVFRNRDSLGYRVPPKADTLLRFKEVRVAVAVTDLIFSKIDIKRIRMVRPEIYAYTAPDGKNNWDIAEMSSDDSGQEQKDEAPLNLSVKRISISDNCTVSYDNRPDSSFMNIRARTIRLAGNMTTDLEKINLRRGLFSQVVFSSFDSSEEKSDSTTTLQRSLARFSIDSLRLKKEGEEKVELLAKTHTKFDLNGVSLIKNVPLEIDGVINVKRGEDSTGKVMFGFNNLRVSLAKLPVVFNGNLIYGNNILHTDTLCGRVENFRIAELSEYIPKEIYPDKGNIETNAAINLDVDIFGDYNLVTGELPTVKAEFSIPESSVTFKKRISRINELAADIKAYYSATDRDSSWIKINKFVVHGRGINVDAHGTIERAAGTDPIIDMKLNAAANLDTLSTLFPAKEGSMFSGTVKADMAVLSRMSRLNAAKLGEAQLSAAVIADSVRIIVPNEDLHLICAGIKCNAATGKNSKDSTIALGTKMLGIRIVADSLYFQNKNQEKITASGMELMAHQSASALTQDTTTVHPLRGSLTARRLTVSGTDSATLRMRGGKISFSILPSNGNFKIPHINLECMADRIVTRDKISRINIRDGKIALNAVLNIRDNNRIKERRERMIDSLRLIWPNVERDSLIPRMQRERQMARDKSSADSFYGQDIDLSVDKSILAFIRKWNLSGNICASSASLLTPYFPLRTRMSDLDFNFTTDKMEFEKTRIDAGRSNFILTGKASGLRRAMAGRGVVKISAEIDSDSLDLNRLLTAVDAGMKFSNMSDSFKDSITRGSDENVARIMEENVADSLDNALIVIPGNIDANLKLKVRSGKYSNLLLQEMSGEMLIKERCMQINGLQALTSAGNMELSAFYATKSKHDISTGFDLVFKDMDIEELISLAPAVDTLLPMLKSFKGVVNCQMAATCMIDTAMNVILPSLKGVARLGGENMVLMDGETFAMVAKKLKFKNREKNIIDKISVEMLVKENKIEIFPFIAQMDRYKFAISGTQNLDMSFNYYISVLKSPIPFRLGVKIFGTVDDMDFKIGKSQFKNDNLPVFSKVIDSTRLNLREQIANIYRIGVDAALKSAGNLQRIEQQMERNKVLLNREIDTLSSDEQTQLNTIEPAPAAEKTPAATATPQENITDSDTTKLLQ